MREDKWQVRRHVMKYRDPIRSLCIAMDPKGG